MTAGMSENEKIVLRSFEAFEAADERAMRGLVTSDFVVHSVPKVSARTLMDMCS